MVSKRSSNTLPKEERLSWKRNIDLLYAKGQSFVAFPLRVVYLSMDEARLVPLTFMVSVPKKRIRKAVGRNYIKRQVREAYRVRKQALMETLAEKNQSMFLAFLYIDKEIHPFANMEKAMTKAVKILQTTQ
jgi:ribonuclease P protein component